MSFFFRQHLISLNKRMDRGEYVDFGQGPLSPGKESGIIDRETIQRTAQLEGIDEEEVLRQRKQFRYLY